MKSCRWLLLLVLQVLIAGSGSAWAQSQAWPARPIRLVVPFSPGGPADIIGRDIAQRLGTALGQPLVIDNRPGGNANIGAEAVARAAPDGCTLLLVTSTHATNASLYKSLRYDLTRDFVPAARLASFPLVLVVHPSLQVSNTRELIALARARPGAISYASAGSGGGAHLAAESFKAATGVDMLHVPYKGTGPAVVALLSGQVGVMFASLPSAIGHIRSGRLAALAVSSRQRSMALPQVPTLADSGLANLEIASWFGLMAPAGTPSAVITRLNLETNRILASPAFAHRLDTEGGEATPASAQEFGAFIRAEIERWAAIVRRSGAQLD